MMIVVAQRTASSPLRVAVVGCGVQGQLHLDCLSQLDDVEVVAVCDIDPVRAEAAAASNGAVQYADHRQLLDRERIDLLTICTMPNTHRSIAVDALGAGAHVLCEKPLALSLQEAQEMVEAAHGARRLLTVGFNLRHSEVAQSVLRFVEAADLGTPICARGWMLSQDIPWWGRHYVKRLSGGGALAATAVHMIDLIMWLAGDPVPTTATASMARVFPKKRRATAPTAEAAAEYDTEDLVSGHVRFRNGFWIAIEGAWTWDDPGSGWNYGFELLGDRGQAGFSPLRLTGERNGELCDLTHANLTRFDFPASTQEEIRDVVAAIREEREPLVRAEQALAVQAVVDALYRSAELGKEVEVESLTNLESLPAPR
jgi:predicted dehydrogenase